MPPSPDPLTNPYAPPAAEPEAAEARGSSRSNYEGERRSVLLLLLISIVTVGLYQFVWYLRRSRFLDSLSADKKVGVLPWLAPGMVGVLVGLVVAHAPPGIVSVLQLASGITNLVLAFRVAHILRSDFARTGRFIGVSALGVFFFSFLYLQYVMNKAASIPARRRKKRKPSAPAAPSPDAEA